MTEQHPMTSKKKANLLSSCLFIVGLLTLIFTNAWWPALMLIVGLPLALRQFLLGRSRDAMLSLLLFVGTFVTVQFDISWSTFLPVLFTLGAIYVFFKEFFGPDETTEEEKEELLNHEIEEDQEKKDQK